MIYDADELLRQSTPPSQEQLAKDWFALLKKYRVDAIVLSKAYQHFSDDNRCFYKRLAITLTFLSATLSVFSTAKEGEWGHFVVQALSYISLLLTGLLNVIDPSKKAQDAHQVALEFGEIASNVEAFLSKKDVTESELQEQLNLTRELLNTWKSLSPPMPDRYRKREEMKHSQRVRARTERKIQ